MRFEQGQWLLGAGLAALVAVFLLLGAFGQIRAVRRFGEEARVLKLVTHRAGLRRAIEGVALVLAVALAFVALAKPQYGKGTRLIPATNLDVVVVLDYSKSMYARDVTPSRTARAKSEVSELIQELAGARFGAVAFAGQPMSFPLTSDGASIAQYFRGLTPNDMPVGGTAIARALEAGRELFSHDPLSKKHAKALMLITDGEDLEGDPIAVAEAAKADGISIHVVQVGGRTPEPIPEVNDQGDAVGIRSDQSGNPLTTSLSAAGEEQLAKIAEVTGGSVVRSERGSMGIATVKDNLKRLMTEELSERVETVYADVYWMFLSAAVGILLLETLAMTIWSLVIYRREQRRRQSTKRRRRSAGSLKQRLRRAKKLRRAIKKHTGAAAAGTLSIMLLFAGCDVERKQAFSRVSPTVEEAMQALDAGSARDAVDLLQEYLATGKCEGGAIGAPASVTEKADASFDLGLGLFKIAESFGKPFTEHEPPPDGGLSPEQEAEAANRRDQAECALRIVRAIALDTDLPVDLRARAYYLAGNLEFLRKDYRAAVRSYDLALRLIPGQEGDAGDQVGRDAAYNRAIALRRIQEEPDASPDASPDGSGDAAPEAGDDAGEPDAGDDAGEPDAGDDGGQDSPEDAGEDAPGDSGDANPPPDEENSEPEEDAAPEPPPNSVNQDERMLDMLEQTPTLQEHDAKNRAKGRLPVGMEDK